MSIDKTGETHLNSRLEYAKGILGLLIDSDKDLTITVLKGDIERFERMLKEGGNNE